VIANFSCRTRARNSTCSVYDMIYTISIHAIALAVRRLPRNKHRSELLRSLTEFAKHYEDPPLMAVQLEGQKSTADALKRHKLF
jgi:hypothetical protein